jgi:hypothetical protein
MQSSRYCDAARPPGCCTGGASVDKLATARVRSASFQFGGRPSQCVGAEPVVIDVNTYAGDGRGDVNDTPAGSRVAQLSADCNDRNAFARPIDVTAIVRQLSVASGVRYVGFNILKANNRQGPGLFELAPGTLTVVLADHAVAPAITGQGMQAAPVPKLSRKEVERRDRRAYIEAERLRVERGDTR